MRKALLVVGIVGTLSFGAPLLIFTFIGDYGFESLPYIYMFAMFVVSAISLLIWMILHLISKSNQKLNE